MPKQAPDKILAEYESAKGVRAFDLKRFVRDHFLIPETKSLAVPPGEEIEAHVTSLWALLRRESDQTIPGSSLLPLPHLYVVPGGRFREVYAGIPISRCWACV